MLIKTDVHVQVVGLAGGTGCGKHDHGLYAHPERERETYDFTIETTFPAWIENK